MVRVIDSNGKVLYSNSMMKLCLGNGQGETCLKIPGSANNCESCIALKCIEDGRGCSTISRIKGRIYAVSAQPVDYSDSVYAMEIFRDITQEQSYKDRLMANNSRMIKDLEIARTLQISILRHNLPELEGYRFCAEFLPCEALGGDMYDCFLTRDGRIIMYVADVSGHGVMPAMLTVYLRQEMFAQFKTKNISPLQVLKNIQDSFEELNVEESIYITIFLLALNPGTGEFICSNAGHSVPPLLAGEGGVTELFLPGAPVCRWAITRKREEMAGVLKRGERLLLYTDGLDGIQTGLPFDQKLKQIMLDGSLRGAQLLAEIKKKFTQTKADDVTMLLCERK
jgi:sigma-B regulation protein RsbU (phosphoserine phosphatase)